MEVKANPKARGKVSNPETFPGRSELAPQPWTQPAYLAVLGLDDERLELGLTHRKYSVRDVWCYHTDSEAVPFL